MTAIYHATPGHLVEQPGPDAPEIPTGIVPAKQLIKAAAAYDNYLATLRTIPCHESCRSLWKDGQKVEEGMDYEVKFVECADHWLLVESFNCPDCKHVAFPLPVKNEPKLEMKDLPEPVGQFIIDQPDVEPLMMPNGAYYHYVDVIKMLVRYKDYSPRKPFTMNKETPKQDAARLYPDAGKLDNKELPLTIGEVQKAKRQAHITCAGMYTGEIEKLKAEVESLRKLLPKDYREILNKHDKKQHSNE